MKRWLVVGLLAAAVLVLVVAGIAVAGWRWASGVLEQRLPATSGVQLDIAPGRSAADILDQLEVAGVIPNADLARLVLVYELGDPPLRAGEYRFEPDTTRAQLRRLIEGRVVLHSVTVLEGLTLEETASSLAASGFGDVQAFLEAMRSPQAIADLDPVAESLEGYLFPDTYSFPKGTSETAIVAHMVESFRRRLLQEIAPSHGPITDVRALVTLASIVEREATLDEERPMIAGVYANRLRLGMGLYADPTIIYALKRAGTWDGNLRRRDLQLDSPYNTYVYPGLPPGPICSPGFASLAAAADPAEVPYLYFVSRNDGSHEFAETLAEHNRNVDRWQRRYWRERWARPQGANGGS